MTKMSQHKLYNAKDKIITFYRHITIISHFNIRSTKFNHRADFAKDNKVIKLIYILTDLFTDGMYNI